MGVAPEWKFRASRAQSKGQDRNGPYSKEEPTPKEWSFRASRGQSGGQDFKGAFSKEVPVPPKWSFSERAYKPGQDWEGPYTSRKDAKIT